MAVSSVPEPWPTGPGDDRLHPAVIVVLVLAGLLALTVGFGLWHLRNDTLNTQTRALASLATASADELERSLQGVKLAMQVTRDELRDGRIVPGAPEASAQLHTRSLILSRVRRLWLVDPQGHVLAASSLMPPPEPATFQPDPLRLGDEGASFSTPFVDPVQGQPAVAMAVRYSGSASASDDGLDGSPTRGWVVAEIQAASLLGSFQRVALARDARMVVQRSDGVILAGTLQQAASLPVAPEVDDRPDADAVQALPDGTLRIVQVRHMPTLGLRLVMTRDVREGLRNWRELAQGSAIALLLVYGVLAALLSRMLRAERARRQTHRALQTVRDRAALAFAAAKEGNWDWEPASGEFYFSPRMKELLGLARDADMAGATLAQVSQTLHPDDAVALREALRLHGQLDTGAQVEEPGAAPSTLPASQGNAGSPSDSSSSSGHSDVLDLVVRAHHPDGQWHAIRLRGTASHDPRGQTLRVAGVALDVTEEQERAAHTRQLEVKLGRAKKLESLGTLVGGVAHDFNNILAAVLGYGEMARAAAPRGSAQSRHLDQVLQAALRGKAVVERLLGFSRGGARPHSVFAVQPVVEQVLGLLAATMESRIHVERCFEPDAGGVPLQVRGDATGLFEAVMNLCTNALQAMQSRPGTLTVGLARRDVAAEHWTSHGRLLPGPYVRLWVADTGPGMPPEVLERLFEPFFTTRGRAGTGLGLTVVHGVVEDFGGGVDVASAPSEGSCFTLYLPLAADQVCGAGPALLRRAGDETSSAQEAPLPLGQGETVLVVDDEPALVALAEELLAELGYEPVGHTDPQRALEALQADPQRFDLLLTDEVMPQLTGTQLAQQARALRADLPILLLSGWGGPQLAQRAAAVGIRRVLSKPIVRAELAAALAQLLASQPTTP